MYEVVYCISTKAIVDTPGWKITAIAKAVKEYFFYCNNVTIVRLLAIDKYAFAFKLSGHEESVLILVSLLNEIKEEVIL